MATIDWCLFALCSQRVTTWVNSLYRKMSHLNFRSLMVFVFKEKYEKQICMYGIKEFCMISEAIWFC